MTAIGMGLIFFLLLIWMNMSAPKKPAGEARGDGQNPAQTTAPADSNNAPQTAQPGQNPAQPGQVSADLTARFGPFAASAAGSETTEVLENSLCKIEFSSKGGRVKSVLLKNFKKVADDGKGNEVKTDLRLLDWLADTVHAEGKIDLQDSKLLRVTDSTDEACDYLSECYSAECWDGPPAANHDKP